MRAQGGQLRFGDLPAGQRVRDNPNRVTARDLLAGEVLHVAKQTADRRAEHMQDAQRRVCALGGVRQ
jgi:hypothetical protein